MKARKILSLVLGVTLAAGLAACGSPAESKSESTKPASSQTSSSTASVSMPETEGEFRSDIHIGYNHQMAGDWIAEFVDKEIASFVKGVMNFKYSDPAFNFDSDQELADCQNLLSAGVDGLIYYAAFDTLTPTISELYQNAETPFVIPENKPIDEVMTILEKNPYFAGAIFADYYGRGYMLGQAATEKGYKNAIMLVGTIGVWGQDMSLEGFKAGFEDGGGKVLEAARINDNSEATQAANDLFAAHGAEADCVYASDPGMLEACFNANSTYGLDLMAFGSDLGSDHVQKVRDGKLIADGGHVPLFAVTAALLINYIDGHPIKDADGKAAIFDDWKFFYIDSSNVDDYETYYLNKNQHIAAEDYQKLLYRYNPDVSYETFENFIQNFSLDYVKANAK